MRLEEAAAILGVSVHADLELLKQTYRKMALAWHPDKCSDPRAKEKFQQISIAYTKLISSRAGENEEDCDSEEEDGHGDADVHEMRAFMRMFMDLVGIFNDDQMTPEDGKLPNGVSFGMMFGNSPDHNEDWSTEDEEDCDGEDDEYDSENGEDGETMWEPMVKHYFHMNLKEEASKAREFRMSAEDADDDDEDDGGRDDEMDAKRKQRNAKKRAEKRRKQKEKKVREAMLKAEEDERAALAEKRSRLEQEEAANKRKEELRRAQEAEDRRRKRLFELVSAGKVDGVIALIDDPSSGLRATERVSNGGRSGAGLLHYCVSSTSDSKEVKRGKLELAKYLLTLRSPPVDLGLVDEDGRTVVHVAAIKDDVSLIELLTGQLKGDSHATERKGVMTDINARCLESGWTPLHYASVNGMTGACKVLIKAGALLNIHAYIPGQPKDPSSDSKGPTPLELVSQYLRNPRNSPSYNAALMESEAELTEAVRKLEELRSQREAEKISKDAKARAEKQRLAAKEQSERELLERKQKQLKERQDREREKLREEEENARLATLAATATAVVDGSGKKKKKKKDKKGGDVPVTTSTASTAPSSGLTTSGGATSGTHPATNQPKESASAKSSYASLSTPMQSASSVVAAVTSAPPISSADVVAEITSRDEMVAHLLAMGFDEADCLAAITACGLDVDKAISWICDRPSPVPEAPPKTNVGDSKDTAKKATSVAVGAKSASAAAAEAEAALKAQKDKEHKEELRRINRAWNARVPQQRAEEERKKLEAERLQKELERQRAIQQQLQQQYSMHSMFNPGMQNGGYPGTHGMYGPHGGPPGMMMQGGMQVPMQQGGGFPDMYRGNGGPGIQQGAYGPSGVAMQAGYGQMGMPQPGNMPIYDPQHGYLPPQQTGVVHQGPGGKSEPMSIPRQRSDSAGQYPPPPSVGLAAASPQLGAKTSPGAQHMQSPSYDQHSMMSGYGIMGTPSGGYGSGYDTSGYDANDDIMNMPEDEGEEYVNGAVHLSAGAKPFVPKFASSPAITPSAPGPISSTSSTAATGSGGVVGELNSLSLPPISLGGISMSDTGATGWPRLDSNWPQDTHRQEDDDDDLDRMMRMHVPLDILSFDGMGDPLALGGLGGSDEDGGLGESLLGRLAGGGDRRRNRGLFFGDSSSTTTSRFLGSSNRDEDDDDAIISHLISDVISSPNGNQSLLFPGHGPGNPFPES